MSLEFGLLIPFISGRKVQLGNVLIVDHQSPIRRSLTSSEHDVNEATNVTAALEMAGKSRIDLMFLDIELPDARGISVL